MEFRIDHHVYVHDGRTERVTRQLDEVLTRLRAIQAQGRVEMASVQDIKDKVLALQASVAAETDIDASVVTLLAGQTAMLVDLKAQLAAAIAAGASEADLQGILDGLDSIVTENTAKANDLAAAVVANTPVA